MDGMSISSTAGQLTTSQCRLGIDISEFTWQSFVELYTEVGFTETDVALVWNVLLIWCGIYDT